MLYRKRLFLLLLLSLPSWLVAKEKPLWELGIGAGAGSFPSYRGASSQNLYALPFPFVIYRGERFSIDREGLHGKLFDSDRWLLELSADAVVPVEEDANGVRGDMPELAPVVELGPSLEYRLHKSSDYDWRLRFPLRSAIAIAPPSITTEGLLFHPNLALEVDRGQWDIGGSLGPLFADESYHGYYYSVSPEYATPQRPSYQAEGGYSGFRLTLGASRYFGDFWLGMFLRYDDLHGVAFSDSPLFEQESALMGGIAAAWVFKRSDRLVTVED